MKFKSPVFSQASGSIAGITYSHNKGGNYIRARATPTNPNTALQAAVRGFVGQLAALWETVLTQAQRDDWDVYAANVTLKNALGDNINVTGLNMYTRSNVARLQAAATRIDAAPTTFNLGDFTAPTFGIDATADEIDVTFTAADAWDDEDDAHMLVYASRPQSASINFFKGPYQFAGSIDGDSTTPPTSPAAIALPFPVVAGQKVFARVVVTRADGRMSLDFRGNGIAA